MKKARFKSVKLLKDCWWKIDISDKALILIMIILIGQCILNLFTKESTSPNGAAISIIVRTNTASIFGYFLSGNFLGHEYDYEKDKEDNNTRSINIENNSTDVKRYICNRTFQVFIALSLCTIALLALIIGDNLNLIPTNNNPTVLQFRDIISGCIGFLLGHNSNFKENNK